MGYYLYSVTHSSKCEYPHDVMIKAMDGGIVVSEFELQRSVTFTLGQIPLV